MEQQVALRRHGPFEDSLACLVRFLEAPVPLGEIQCLAALVHVGAQQPRGRCQVRVPRPASLIAMTIEARSLRQRTRSRRIPRWLNDDAWVRMVATIGNELRDHERATNAQQQYAEEYLPAN